VAEGVRHPLSYISEFVLEDSSADGATEILCHFTQKTQLRYGPMTFKGRLFRGGHSSLPVGETPFALHLRFKVAASAVPLLENSHGNQRVRHGARHDAPPLRSSSPFGGLSVFVWRVDAPYRILWIGRQLRRPKAAPPVRRVEPSAADLIIDAWPQD
jgi:hypothetical protein